MRRSLHALLAVAVLFSATTFYAPTAQAQPEYATWWIYYDSSLNENGYETRDCAFHYYSTGTLSGPFKEILRVGCYGAPEYSEYYHYCSGNWIQVAYLGDTSC